VAAYLAYGTPRGSTLIDREAYLPKVWTDEAARCAKAGVPDVVGFATKVTLARRMLARALDDEVPAAWCTADEFYGGHRHLRRDLQTRGLGCVLAVARSHRVTARPADGPIRVDRLAAALPAEAWNRISAGAGLKGDRVYEWAWVALTPPDDKTGGHHALLVRRRISDGELAFYRCQHLRVVVAHHDHLLGVGQIDPDDRVGHRHQLAQPGQPRIAVAVTPGHPTTVGHERPPPAMGHQALSASGGRSYARDRHAERLSMPPVARGCGGGARRSVRHCE
jgi:hypothetical protein